jgi:hypothetical protein
MVGNFRIFEHRKIPIFIFLTPKRGLNVLHREVRVTPVLRLVKSYLENFKIFEHLKISIFIFFDSQKGFNSKTWVDI